MQICRNWTAPAWLLLFLLMLLGLNPNLQRTGKTTKIATTDVGIKTPEAQPNVASHRNLAATTTIPLANEPEPRVALDISISAGVIDYSRQRVFRLILEAGKCRLDAMEEVTGDFRPRRGRSDRHAGMITCRLVDGAGTTLAEETVHPVDHVCVVLDPNGSAGNPSVTLLGGLGPQLFQVRFPAALEGEKLEVYRITQTQPSSVEHLLLSTNLD